MKRQLNAMSHVVLAGWLVLTAPIAWCAGDTGVSQIPADTSRELYYEQLGQLIPDWQRIAKDPQFLKWLDAPSDSAGITMRQKLTNSYVSRNPIQSARVFERWLSAANQQFPQMRREDLVRVGAEMFDEACRGCHTLTDAKQRVMNYSEKMRKSLATQGNRASIPSSVSLFFLDPPDGRHDFAGRGSFEIAGLVTFLTEAAFGSTPEPMQSGAIEAERLVNRMFNSPSRLDPLSEHAARAKNNDGDRKGFASQFGYRIAVPPGWIQIPAAEIMKYKKDNVPAGVANQIIWDTAIQRGNSGQWFHIPYAFLQITPASITGLNRLPTEQEFLKVVNSANLSVTASSKQFSNAIAAVQDPQERAALESARASAASAKVQFDLERRQYSYSLDMQVGGESTVGMFALSTFLPNGNLLQITVYDARDDLKTTSSVIKSMGKSIETKGAAPTQR